MAALNSDQVLQLDRETGAILTRVETPGSGPDDVAVGPDGAVYWTGFVDGSVGRITDGVSETIASVGAGANPIGFTDDGQLIVGRAVTADGLYRVPLDGGEPEVIAPSVGDMNAFVIDDNFVVGPVGGVLGPGGLNAVDLTTGEVAQLGKDFPAGVTASALDPDGQLHLLSANGQIWRFDDVTGTVEPALTLNAGIYDNLDFAPDGTLYVTSFTQPLIVIVETGRHPAHPRRRKLRRPMRNPKITLIGAGGMSFGPTMVNDVIHTPALAGSRLMLHDVNEERLQRAYRFASKLNAANGAPIILDYSVDPSTALDGADYCLSSAEFGRFTYWRQDYEIPNRLGARQITGENGGPGAVFHSLRSIKNTLSICADIEKYCPDAFLLNLSNPMSRVTLAINRGTNVANVGMCHEMPIGIARLAKLLRMRPRDIEAKASGINHFTFFTEMRDKRTGEDLIPRIQDLFAKPFFDYSPRTVGAVKQMMRSPALGLLADQLYSPVVAHVVRTYGIVPCSVDSHIGEYLPFTLDVGSYHPKPVDIFEGLDGFTERWATRAADTSPATSGEADRAQPRRGDSDHRRDVDRYAGRHPGRERPERRLHPQRGRGCHRRGARRSSTATASTPRSCRRSSSPSPGTSTPRWACRT